MNATFDHTEDITRHIKTFWFRPERKIGYVAGQFTELHLPHNNADARSTRRWFTLSSSPTEELIGITTKFASLKGSTFKQQLQRLQPGTSLTLTDPMGDFVLPKDPTIPLVLVAAGMGITPMRSMVKWLLDTGEKRKIHLIYAVTHLEELVFDPLFKQYGLKFTTIVKNPPADYVGETGSLHADRILKLIDNDDTPLLYLSGPELLIETL